MAQEALAEQRNVKMVCHISERSPKNLWPSLESHKHQKAWSMIKLNFKMGRQKHENNVTQCFLTSSQSVRIKEYQLKTRIQKVNKTSSCFQGGYSLRRETRKQLFFFKAGKIIAKGIEFHQLIEKKLIKPFFQNHSSQRFQ